ncbi:indolepyruvate oxidoreductase subunit beta family protein [Roseomonas sp. BN140053]|uniref:indolepyruvate oxidoreductase subunit beta family protein n=1 Tax=Roseomonas sp. BN140053 TaxID=3391898 RepID=UPI0039E8C464
MGVMEATRTRSINVAVLAMGGQGGGVLVDWIVSLAEAGGYYAQSTAVPGVAQRTGATIYYLEMVELGERRRGQTPVLALTPTPGELDVVIGAELMEAGRAMQRGLVTPDRTTLIASAHRAYAVDEKSVPGDGAADNTPVYQAGAAASRRFVCFDMAALAERSGSVVSAVLFGALAATESLPFPRAAFEDTIRRAGVGVEASLRAFALGFDGTLAGAAGGGEGKVSGPVGEKRLPDLSPIGHAGFDALLGRIGRDFPAAAQPMLVAGLRKVVDFQDLRYGAEYLDRVAEFARLDGTAAGAPLTLAAAKHVANAMAYDDVIRVADLKTRASRFERVRREQKAKPDQIVYTTEFMHPRLEEVAGSLPAPVGRFIEGSPNLSRLLDRWINRGRRVRTGTVRWFVPLWVIGGMRRVRRGTLRHAREVAHMQAWLDHARRVAPTDPALAAQVLECRRLIKGYSDTHARGTGKFDRVVAMAVRLEGRTDAADWVRRLREAALRDEEGKALGQAIATIESFLPTDGGARAVPAPAPAPLA